MRLFKVPGIVQRFFPQFVWRIPRENPTVFLTFDDGPHPEVTEFVLTTLNRYNIKATFFCVGENIARFPSVSKQIIKEGHSIANHTYNHLKGWETPTNRYIENVNQAQKTIEEYSINRLFRPPYGRITKSQSKELKAMNYKIIMWHILTYDYDKNLSIDFALKNICKKTRNGSIVVFHDSVKAFPQLQKLLPQYIQYLIKSGFKFDIIS